MVMRWPHFVHFPFLPPNSSLTAKWAAHWGHVNVIAICPPPFQ